MEDFRFHGEFYGNLNLDFFVSSHSYLSLLRNKVRRLGSPSRYQEWFVFLLSAQFDGRRVRVRSLPNALKSCPALCHGGEYGGLFPGEEDEELVVFDHIPEIRP